jgi:hypothetical protein
MEGHGFQEPRLVLYSPIPKDLEAASKPAFAPVTVQQLRQQRRSHTIRSGFDITKAAVRTTDPPMKTLSSWQQEYPPVPTDIIVSNNKGKSSEQSVVSEITQPLGIVVEMPRAMGNMNDNRDIAEMKRRLEAIKERRARIKGQQPPLDIPSVVIRNHQRSEIQEPNPHQSYRERQVDKLEANEADARQKLQHQSPPRRKPSFQRQRSCIDPPGEQTEMEDDVVDKPVEADAHEAFTLSSSVSDEVVAAPEPTISPPKVPPPSKPPATPPREVNNFASELPDFKSTMKSLSPKSAGVSTCHTFDETMEGSYDDSFSNKNPSWTLQRLLCKSSTKLTAPQRTESGFGPIRASRSLDYFGSSIRRNDDPPGVFEKSVGKSNNHSPTQPPLVTRSTFDDAIASPPFQEEDADASDIDDADDSDVIDAEGFLIGRAALKNGRFTSYPRPPLPGKAYSEILSEKSSLGLDEGMNNRSLSTSCLRRDPWYMTRRMKLQQQQKANDDREGVMHTVVFVKQKP